MKLCIDLVVQIAFDGGTGECLLFARRAPPELSLFT
jgi:hypothetical protein